MATTTQQTETKRGFLVPCPKCSAEGDVHLDCLEDMDNAAAFSCGECGESFSRADVEAFIARWSSLLKWLDLCPTYTAE